MSPGNGNSRPAFIVYKATIAGFVHHVPASHGTVERRSVRVSSLRQIAQAQRETRTGCLLSLLGLALLFLIPAAFAVIMWWMYGPR
jgi:hypothetical protein